MLYLLSPSKTLNMDAQERITSPTQPRFLQQSEQLIAKAKTLSAEEIQSLMKVSDKLAELNHQRFQDFTTPFTARNAKPCILAFKGDVYDGLDAETLSDAEIAFAQPRLRILSGLYGLLRPQDLMQAYRLEMGRKFATDAAKDLYGFWGEQITEQLNTDADAIDAPAIINLASNEYFKAVQPKALKKPLITVHFKEKRGEEYKVLGLFAKRARGMMTRYALQSGAKRTEDLLGFDAGGYHYAPEMSDEANLTFVR